MPYQDSWKTGSESSKRRKKARKFLEFCNGRRRGRKKSTEKWERKWRRCHGCESEVNTVFRSDWKATDIVSLTLIAKDKLWRTQFNTTREKGRRRTKETRHEVIRPPIRPRSTECGPVDRWRPREFSPRVCTPHGGSQTYKQKQRPTYF